MATAKKASKKSTEVATIDKNTAMAEVPDYGDEYDQGFDPNATEDLLIPRLIVLQSNSPQCLPVKDGGVDGAKAGMLFNSVTQELMEECTFVPACSEKCYNEWIDREDGGGFVARYELHDPFVIQKRKETPRGKITFDGDDGKKHQLTETVYLYCVPVDEEGDPIGGFFVLDFTSTKLKEWRAWSTKIYTYTTKTKDGSKRRPPFYAHTVKLSTVGQKNDQGRWYNPKLDPARENPKTKKVDLASSLISPASEAFGTAKDLAQLVKDGLAKPQQAEDDGAQSSAPQGDQSKGAF